MSSANHPDADTAAQTETWRSRLSALGDGELDAADDVRQAVQQWAALPEARSAWREYQVIGDVLRSDELAGRADEAAFLSGLRERLAAEPVVLAPAAVSSPTVVVAGQAYAARRRQARWLNVAAVAAGFGLVAVVLVGLNPGSGPTPGSGPVIANSAPTTPGVIKVTDMPPSAPGAAEVAAVPPTPGAMIRDPRLDAYLNAHRQFGASAGLGITPGSVRPTAVSDGTTR